MRKSPILQGIVVLLALALGGRMALADKVDDLMRQLKDSDYKVRLSAALNLGRLGNKKAIAALTDSLKDPEKTVRGVASAALSKLIDASVDGQVRNRAISELERVAKNDTDAFVRSQAQKSYDALKGLATTGPGPGPQPGAAAKAYVEVGPMADNTKQGGAAVLAAMRTTVEKTLNKKNPALLTKWPSGKAPTKADLVKAGLNTAFLVDGSITVLEVKKLGSMAEINCKVKLYIATFPEKAMFAFVDGGAQLQTGTSDKDVTEGKAECVAAVIEDLVARQILPTLKQRVP